MTGKGPFAFFLEVFVSRFVALTVLLLLSGSREALAQGARPWIAVSAAYNTYAMDEVNNGIESLNEGIAPASMDEIHSAFGYGASAGVDLSRFTASVAYERLPATSQVSTSGTDWEYDLVANTIGGRIAMRTAAIGPFRTSVGVGGGVAFVSGEFGRTDNTPFLRAADSRLPAAGQAVILGPRIDVSGNGLLLEGFVQGDASIGPRLSIAPSIGYRYASIEANEDGGEGEGVGTFDFSGLAARVALRFALD